MIIIIKTSSTGPSWKNKVVYKLLSQFNPQACEVLSVPLCQKSSASSSRIIIIVIFFLFKEAVVEGQTFLSISSQTGQQQSECFFKSLTL